LTVCGTDEQATDPNVEGPRVDERTAIERLLTVEEVARVLHVSRAWVYDHADRKRPLIQSVRLGKAVRFRAEDVQTFIETMMRHIA
jgi:excisionase family DNA binding protein